MTKGRLWIGGVIAAWIAAVPVQASAQARAVIELFTSQGCSSCPAADRLLGELKRDSSLVALSLPIDYWDYLGWKDTLANPLHTARQKAYSQMRRDRDVYTPQMVVNGVAQVLGSDRAAIARAIAESPRGVVSVPITLSVADGRVTASVSSDKSEQRVGMVWLCPISGSVEVAIGRGENQGRTVTYTNVVRRWVDLGAWSGEDRTWTVPLTEVKAGDTDTIAVIIQSGSADKPGAVLGAAITSLR